MFECDKSLIDVLRMIYTWLYLGHFSVHVGDGLQHSEKIVKKSRIAPLNAIIIIICLCSSPGICKRLATLIPSLTWDQPVWDPSWVFSQSQVTMIPRVSLHWWMGNSSQPRGTAQANGVWRDFRDEGVGVSWLLEKTLSITARYWLLFLSLFWLWLGNFCSLWSCHMEHSCEIAGSGRYLEVHLQNLHQQRCCHLWEFHRKGLFPPLFFLDIRTCVFMQQWKIAKVSKLTTGSSSNTKYLAFFTTWHYVYAVVMNGRSLKVDGEVSQQYKVLCTGKILKRLYYEEKCSLCFSGLVCEEICPASHELIHCMFKSLTRICATFYYSCLLT